MFWLQRTQKHEQLIPATDCAKTTGLSSRGAGSVSSGWTDSVTEWSNHQSVRRLSD